MDDGHDGVDGDQTRVRRDRVLDRLQAAFAQRRATATRKNSEPEGESKGESMHTKRVHFAGRSSIGHPEG